jgi:hypothetical protein
MHKAPELHPELSPRSNFIANKRFAGEAVWMGICLVLLAGLLTIAAKVRTHTVLASSQLPRAAAAQGTPGVTVFDVTGAGTGMLQGTVAIGVDAAGDVVGEYFDKNDAAHGYVRSASGTVSTFDAPGAGSGSGPYNNVLKGTIPLEGVMKLQS